MIIDEQKTGNLFEQFKAIKENSVLIKRLKEDTKELTAANKDLFKTIAEQFEPMELSEIVDTYKYWLRLEEEGQDSLENITTLFEALKEKMEVVKLEE